MHFLRRFFGDGDRASGGPAVANPALETPVGLQVLFAGPPALDADALADALRGYSPGVGPGATFELFDVAAERAARGAGEPGDDDGDGPPPGLLGLAAWGDHAVKLIGFDAPVPADPAAAGVPAHLDDDLKAAVRGHAAHVLLDYAGYDPDPVEQFVALAVVAAVLGRFGAVAVLNEAARSAVPASSLLPHPEDGDADMLTVLRELPLPLLYGGFSRFAVAGEPGVWMRTRGNHLLGLPDLALRAESHAQGADVFELFAHVLQYLRETGRTFRAGDAMQVGADTFLRLRDRTDDEWYLDSGGEMLVADRVPAAELTE